MVLGMVGADFHFRASPQRRISEKSPEMRGKDLKPRAVCGKFAQIPTSVMSFLEGTRALRQASISVSSRPFVIWLKPRRVALRWL